MRNLFLLLTLGLILFSCSTDSESTTVVQPTMEQIIAKHQAPNELERGEPCIIGSLKNDKNFAVGGTHPDGSRWAITYQNGNFVYSESLNGDPITRVNLAGGYTEAMEMYNLFC